MVYVPIKAVRRLMLRRWRENRRENPELPRPTMQDTEIEWFKMLDWLPPKGGPEFPKFLSQFPPEDRRRISR